MLLGISSENRVDPNGNRICVSYPQEYEETEDWILLVGSSA